MSPPERLSTPSPPPSADPGDTGRHAALPSFAEQPLGESKADRALRVALEARNGLGRPPDASGYAGSGLWAYAAGIKASVDKVVTWTESTDRATERRLGWGARLGWEVLRTLIPITLAALLAWAGGFLHR